MAILGPAYLATIKVWSASLVIGTTTFPLSELPSRTLGTTQARGTCACKTNVFPDFPSGTVAYVDVTLNGATERFFTGKMDVRPVSDNPPTYDVTLIDNQTQLDVPLGEQIVWSNAGWVATVRWVLNRAGIADTDILTIYDPGANYTIAPNYAITLESTNTLKSLMDELMEFAGTQMLVSASGQVQIVNAPGWPSEGPVATYAFGANKSIFEFGFASSQRTVGSSESVIAAFKAKGPRRPDMQIPDATFTLSGVTGKKDEQEYRLIQTDDAATAVAEREIVRRNRDSTLVEMNAPLNLMLRPLETVLFRNAVLGFPTDTPALILTTASSAEMMTVQLSVGARPASGTVSHVPPPSATFTMRYEQQPISLAGIIAPYYIVEAISTASDPSGFGITSIAWAATCAGTVDPTSVAVDLAKPAENPIFVFSTTEGAAITLTIESSSGEGATSTQVVAPPPSELFTRQLSVACADGWRILNPTGWRTFGTDCTAVPGINDVGPFLAGFADGKLYQSNDALATAPTLLHTFGGLVRCLFVNATNNLEVLAGIGADLMRSSDGGLSWTLVHTFPADVNYCESSGANPNEMRVCAGVSLYISYDGSAFTALLTGPDGSTCRKVGSAPWGHLAVWSGSAAIADGAKFEEGGSLDWSGVATEFLPVDLSSVTPLQYEEGYILAAGAGNDLVRDGLYGQLTYLSAGDGITFLYKVDATKKVTYLCQSSRGGPHKLVERNKAFLIDDLATVYHIGYGQASAPALPSEFVLLPSGATGAADKVHHYIPGTGYSTIDLPIAEAVWTGMDVNPVRSNEWLIWTEKRAFWTGNAGVAWTEIYVPRDDTFYIEYLQNLELRFTGSGADWIMAWKRDTARYGPQYLLARGVHGMQMLDGFTTKALRYLTRGYGSAGEMWAYDANTSEHVWFDATSLSVTTVASSSIYTPSAVLNPREHRNGLAVWGANIGYTANYASTPPTAVIAGGTSVAVVDVSDTVQRIFVGGRAGVGEILNLLTSPTIAVVAGGAAGMGTMHMGSRRRGCAVADDSGMVWTYNGSQWGAIAMPAGLSHVGTIGVPEP